MVAPYLPKLVKTYQPDTSSYGYHNRILSCPTPGAGMRPSIEGLTFAGWVCSASGTTFSLNAAPPGGGRFFEAWMQAGFYYPSSGTGLVQGIAETNMVPLIEIGFSNGNREEENPTMNITPGDGYHYTSSVFFLIMSYNFLTRRAKMYANDTPMHVFLMLGGGDGPPLNNTDVSWNITFNSGNGPGFGSVIAFDRYMELDDPAIRRLFINADLSGVPLPSDGHVTIDGDRVLPVAYFRVPDDSTDANDFKTNHGYGPPWTFVPDAPSLTLGSCLTSTFVGDHPPPPLIPLPTQATSSLWTLKPDWANPVVETISWKTDVLSSQMLYEQRRRLRTSPRRTITANYTLIGSDRRLFDSYMIGPAMGRWTYPLWWENMPLTSQALIGDTLLNCDTRNTEVVPGSVVILIGNSPFIYEARTVSEVTSFNLTFTEGLERQWPRGSNLYMTKLCQLTGTQRAQRYADDAMKVTLQFETIETNDFPSRTPPMTVRDYPVLDLFPDEARDLSTDYRHAIREFDNQVSAGLSRVDAAGIAYTVQQFSWFAEGRDRLKSLRNLLYYLQGRLVPLWVPTYYHDLEIRPGTFYAPEDSELIVVRGGYTEYVTGAPYTRRTLLISLRNGVNLIRDVTSSLVLNDAHELITLSSPFGLSFTAEKVVRSCFLAFSRQDQDDIDIEHHTDSSGVSTILTTFVSVLFGRSSATYETNIFTGSIIQDSGYTAPPADVQVEEPVIVVSPTTPVDPGMNYGQGTEGGGGPE
jgi:hypothetical protein